MPVNVMGESLGDKYDEGQMGEKEVPTEQTSSYVDDRGVFHRGGSNEFNEYGEILSIPNESVGRGMNVTDQSAVAEASKEGVVLPQTRIEHVLGTDEYDPDHDRKFHEELANDDPVA